MTYKPDQKLLEKYASVLVNFALGNGKGIKKNDVVYVSAYEYAKPLYVEVLRAITKAGGHAITRYIPNEDHDFNISRDFYVNAKEHQINFFPSKYFRGLIDEIDHYLFIASETDMESLKGIDAKKIMARSRAQKPFKDWLYEKEGLNKLSWTIALYGTEVMAKETGMRLEEYWLEIIKACFLDSNSPITKWKSVGKQIADIISKLNELPIDRLHIKGPNADLKISLGKRRVWDGGGGSNIPSFEIFTSPDWHGTEGWIKFDKPVYAHGQLIKDIRLEFKNGIVVKAEASDNLKLLKQMIASPGGNKIGEFSLTDRRFSRITKFMAETLFDENVGGPNGNTHIAIGSSFHKCHKGKFDKFTKKDWEDLGFNDSVIHQDIVSTSPRTVTAILKNGTEKVIYKNGRFTV
jgi:aminopeptidase